MPSFPSQFLNNPIPAPFATLLNQENISSYLFEDKAPIPPENLREYYHRGNDFSYWCSGLSDYQRVVSASKEASLINRPNRILELGSSSGRVIRHFSYLHPDSQCIACDLGLEQIAWADSYLRSNVVSFNNKPYPGLPLKSSSIDLIIAFSVFTHIGQHEVAWLLELERLVSSEGVLFITIMDHHGWMQTMAQDWRWESASKFSPDFCKIQRYSPMPAGKSFFSAPNSDYGNTFHSRSYINERWGLLFDIIDILEPPDDPALGIQSSVIMKKKVK